MESQKRLMDLKPKYYPGPYNKSNKIEQWIRISDGCPTNCPFCYCPKDLKYYNIPDIIRNKVNILDFNILAQPNIKTILKTLAKKKVNRKTVNYNLKGGLDKYYIDLEMARLIKKTRIKKIFLAWNWSYKKEFIPLFDARNNLIKAGYKNKDINVYIICNWKIPYSDCVKKLDVLKVWGVDVFDCYYDNQTFPNVIPLHWNYKELKSFRAKCRKHFFLIKFRGYDPEINKHKKYLK